MNWRKPIIYSLLYCSGSKIPQNIKEIKEIGSFSEKAKREYQEKKLKRLLLYAHEYVPYYRKVLKETGVVKEGRVFLENFDKIPILTKEIIRKQGKNLHSKEKRKGVYENTSGGSTGEPVRFLQDRYYDDWNIANKIFYKTFGNQDIGERELRLWGSERDILEGKESFKTRLRNFLYNRRELNAFRMSEGDMGRFVKEWNSFKPLWVEAYVQSIYEFGRFIEKNNFKIHSPKGILTSAGTLYPDMKKEIEKVFKTKVFNRYGSREVGDIAMSKWNSEKLEICFWNQKVEVLEGEKSGFGKVIVTNLNNYSMPLIRYDIGDTAKGEKGFINDIKGRISSYFLKKDGTKIDGGFFRQVLYGMGWIDKYQIVQKEYDLIVYRFVTKEEERSLQDEKRIIKSVEQVMGENCKVQFEFLKEIEPLKSGKYLYTICEIE